MFEISFYIFSLFLSITDYKRFLVPNNVVLSMSIMMLIFGLIEEKILFSTIVLLVLIFLFFILLLLSKPDMILGGGDIKYILIVGLYLGIFNFSIFLIITGILQTLILVYIQKIKNKKIAPMVPIMFISVIIVDILSKMGYSPFA